MNSSNKFIRVLIIAIVTAFLSTSVVWAQESSPFPSSTATPPPSPPIQESGDSLYGQVKGIAADNKSFTFQSVMHSEIIVMVNQDTIFSIIDMSPFNLYMMIEILSDVIGQKALLAPVSSPVMPNISGTPMPGMTDSNMECFSQEGRFEDITIGDTVIVMGISDNNPARKVYILKFAENISFAEGTISAFSYNALVITPPSPALGPAVSLGWDVNSRFILQGVGTIQTGQNGRIIYDSSSNMLEIVIVNPSHVTSSATPAASPSPSASSDTGAVDINLSIQNSQFDQDFLMAPVNSRETIHFTNKDNGIQHNFSVYNNWNVGTDIFKGTPVTGPGDTIYQFTAPDINATYFFRCDNHPEENGQLMVGEYGE
jgi:plastocyanin